MLATTPRVMVCLHGLGASSSSFNDLRQSVHLDGCELITPDCAGHAKAMQQTYHGDPLIFAAEKISADI
jgi:hypothetical protein